VLYVGVRGGLVVTNREVRGSNPDQGRNLVWDCCFTCTPWPTRWETL